ncbi:hypothetical protein U1Q18_034382, partial [Sarracenia purpurea var. burkii]
MIRYCKRRSEDRKTKCSKPDLRIGEPSCKRKSEDRKSKYSKPDLRIGEPSSPISVNRRSVSSGSTVRDGDGTGRDTACDEAAAE